MAGSRHITNYALVWRLLDTLELPEGTFVICGMAPGVDRAGREWAIAKDIPVVECPADWKTYGKSAGPIRNKEMASIARSLVLIWDGKSAGSANMKTVAKSYGLEIEEFVVK